MKGAEGPFTKLLNWLTARFRGSTAYWERRYAHGGNSGAGSYGPLAGYKAGFLNRFLAAHPVAGAIEFGCGDGHQLGLIRYPRYIGLDVSHNAVARCRERFAQDPSKSFYLYEPLTFADRCGLFRAELSLSLDVLYHLIEDDLFLLHLTHLFAASTRFVIIYSTNQEGGLTGPHVRHRKFTDVVERLHPGWALIAHEQNPFAEAVSGERSPADFFVYAREPLKP